MATFNKPLILLLPFFYLLLVAVLVLFGVFTISDVKANSSVVNTQSNTQITNQNSEVWLQSHQHSQQQSYYQVIPQKQQTEEERKQISNPIEVSLSNNPTSDSTIGQIGNSEQNTQTQANSFNSTALWIGIMLAVVIIGYLVFSLRPSTRN